MCVTIKVYTGHSVKHKAHEIRIYSTIHLKIREVV